VELLGVSIINAGAAATIEAEKRTDNFMIDGFGY